jgi:exopolyphosphatase/guanosine-5'-triphosphate,3'-diphosphate pyrophosphatase
VKVARVDRCRRAIAEVLASGSKAVPYRDDLERGNGRLSAEILWRGAQAIQSLQGKSPVAPIPWSGVATAAFREAHNADEALAYLRRETGAALRVVSQVKEAILGSAPVLARMPERREDLVVWDVGGGSTQVTFWKGGAAATLLTRHGAISVKHLVLKLRGEGTSARSPNPVGAEVAARAQAAIAEEIEQADAGFVREIRTKPRKLVVGIGAVLGRGVAPYVARTGRFTRAQVEEALRLRVTQTDGELVAAGWHRKFVDTAATNLLLALAYMRTLGIDEVQVQQADLTDGVLLEEDLWPRTDGN